MDKLKPLLLAGALLALLIAGYEVFKIKRIPAAQDCAVNTLVHSDGSKTTVPGICNETTRVEGNVIHGDIMPAALYDLTLENSEVFMVKSLAPAGTRGWTPQPKDYLRGEYVYLEP